MKKLVMLLSIALSSVAAQASVNASSSWGEIGSTNLHISWPQIGFGSSFVSVNGVCAAGDKLYAKVSRCVQQITRRGDIECTAYQTVTASRARTAMVTREITNDRGTVLRRSTRLETVPMTYMVGVYGRENNRGDRQLKFKKSFTIPACR